MKGFKVFLILFGLYLAWQWVNANYPRLRLADMLPFSHAGHSDLYNWACLIMLCLAIWGVLKRRR